MTWPLSARTISARVVGNDPAPIRKLANGLVSLNGTEVERPPRRVARSLVRAHPEPPCVAALHVPPALRDRVPLDRHPGEGVPLGVPVLERAVLEAEVERDTLRVGRHHAHVGPDRDGRPGGQTPRRSRSQVRAGLMMVAPLPWGGMRKTDRREPREGFEHTSPERAGKDGASARQGCFILVSVDQGDWLRSAAEVPVPLGPPVLPGNGDRHRPSTAGASPRSLAKLRMKQPCSARDALSIREIGPADHTGGVTGPN